MPVPDIYAAAIRLFIRNLPMLYFSKMNSKKSEVSYE